MAAASGPRIKKDSSIFSFDYNSAKFSKDPISIREHGLSNWYCVQGGTIRYSAVYPYTRIYENLNGVVTLKAITAGTPDSGSFLGVQNAFYFSNKAIYLVNEGFNNAIVPSTLASTTFYAYSNRGGDSILSFYAVHRDASVDIYINTANGINEVAPTANLTASKGTVASYTATPDVSDIYIQSDYPIIVSMRETSGDAFVLSPCATKVWFRDNGSLRTRNLLGQAVALRVFNYIQDENGCQAVEIADGAGTDALQGLGDEYLSDIYSYGNVLSDYTIVSASDNTVVDVEYYSGGQWNLLEQHTIPTSNTDISRDGSAGPGVTATNLFGTAANFASGANLWKFTGNVPFYIGVNLNGDDEETLLGWMKDTPERKTRGAPERITIPDLFGGSKITPVNFTSFERPLSIDSESRYFLAETPYTTGTTAVTWNIWVSGVSGSDFNYFLHNNSADTTIAQSHMCIGMYSTGELFGCFDGQYVDMTSDISISPVISRMATLVWDGTNQYFYVNGELKASKALSQANFNANLDSVTGIGASQTLTGRRFNGRIRKVDCYSEALSKSEIQKLYRAQFLRQFYNN